MIYPPEQAYSMRIIADTAANKEPISIDVARWHLNILTYGDPPSHHDDAWLTAVGIPGARDFCERYTARSIGQKTIQVTGNAFPIAGSRVGFWFDVARYWGEVLRQPALPLPMGPVRAIDSIQYLDSAGILQPITDAALDDSSEPPALRAAFGSSWPIAQASPNSIRVRYFSGYTLPSDPVNDRPLPPSLMNAMLLILGHLYENRENTTIGRAANIQEIPLGAEAFLLPYSLRNGFA